MIQSFTPIVSTYQQTIPFSLLPSDGNKDKDSFQNITWGRKRSTATSLHQERPTKTVSLSDDMGRMNQLIGFCDDIVKMFDELIIPAARLLDIVESRIKDYHLIHQQSTPILKNPSQILPDTAWEFKTIENSRLKEYACPTFKERDRIDWGDNYNLTESQYKQAEEEAETDDEMIKYGVKVASKNVRTACKAYKSREWSMKSRLEYYRLSVKRLKELSRKRR